MHRFSIQRRSMLFKISNQLGTMALSSSHITQGINLQRDVMQTQLVPQLGTHQYLLGIDIRPGKTQCLYTYLVKLTVTPFLRPFVTEHRTAVVQTLRRIVQEVVL